jgi:hypothetical protein
MAAAAARGPARPRERAAAIGALTYLMAMRVGWRSMRGLFGRAHERAPTGIRASVLAPLGQLARARGARSRT